MAERFRVSSNGPVKTVIITGGANGIGAQTVRTFYDKGCNVVIADLPSSRTAAEGLMATLADSGRVSYVRTDILNWDDMKSLYRTTIERFGRVDIVVANAGMMESKGFFDFETDENGDLKEPSEAYRVLDVNLKGTMNTLRLALHHMRSQSPDQDGARGSVVLIASTSGYFGGTSVVSYVASKHGVVGLSRASQRMANENSIRLNVVAPFFTPTHITGSYSVKWRERGLPANTVEDVAQSIVKMSVNPDFKGRSLMVAGKMEREIEGVRTEMIPQWLGGDIAQLMSEAGKFFDELGGYPLPKPRLA